MADDHNKYTICSETQQNELLEVDERNETMDSIGDNPERLLQCHICCRMLGHRSSLYKHLKYIHKIEPAHRLTIVCGERNCKQSFPFIFPFRKHLADKHGFKILIDKCYFANMADFYKWKRETELTENAKFIVSTGPRSSKMGKSHYFRCRQTGTYKPEIKKRQMQGRDMGCHCIASMVVVEEASGVMVEFCRTHYGHEVASTHDTLQRIKLEPVENKEIDWSNLDTFLSTKDKEILLSAVKENKDILNSGEELLFETEQAVVLSLPPDFLSRLLAQDISDNKTDNMEIQLGETSTAESDSDNEDTIIFKSLGNGVFVDLTSNKRLQVDSLATPNFISKKGGNSSRKVQVTAKESVIIMNHSGDESSCEEDEEKETEQMNVNQEVEKEEGEDEEEYEQEPEETSDPEVEAVRDRILQHLQTILVRVNSDNDRAALQDIENHLLKITN